MVPLSLAGRLVCRMGLEQLRPALRVALRKLPPPVARRLATWSNSGKS
jgi:hypothetical protein